MKKYLLIFILCYSRIIAQQPDAEGSLVKWMTLEDAMEKVKHKPKPILIDFYTDWCGWCKTMMQTTYASQEISNYINTYFFPVKFDAEGKDTIEYLGQKYIPTSDKPRTTHPLAAKLLNNNLMYPSTLFLHGYNDEKKEFKVNMIANGYLDENKIEPILVFILENAGRNSSYDDFRNYFQQAFAEIPVIQPPKKIRWQYPRQAFGSTVPKKKKTLVLLNTSWCISCKIMKSTSFIDTTVENYVMEKFNLVDFDPDMTDTVYFKGKKYYNEKSSQAPFHQLAYYLGKNTIIFPSVVVLDENMEIIDVIYSYLPPEYLKEIIYYYGNNINKVKSWQDYIKGKKHG